MANHTYQKYMEAEVLGADSVELIQLLYRGALEAVGAARRHLRAGNIADRSRQITRAWSIVQELAQSLDHARGGELSPKLADLYAYVQGRLLEGNAQQMDAPLAEVETLLGTLAEAWRGITPMAPPEASYVPVRCSL